MASPVRFLSVIQTAVMKNEIERTVYEISVDDLQRVAIEVLYRKLTNNEIALVGNAVGDYIDWFQAIENAINSRLAL
jgi:hypothetical protein